MGYNGIISHVSPIRRGGIGSGSNDPWSNPNSEWRRRGGGPVTFPRLFTNCAEFIRGKGEPCSEVSTNTPLTTRDA